MAAGSKALENIEKNLTLDQKQARQQAENETLPARDVTRLPIPGYVAKNVPAKRYWDSILGRADDILLLDDLDAEMLGVYCVMLTRHEELSRLCKVLMKDVSSTKRSGEVQMSAAERVEARLAAADRVESLLIKLQNHERTLLQYAEKLGLTPSGRIRLARKRAESYVADENADLYGD